MKALSSLLLASGLVAATAVASFSSMMPISSFNPFSHHGFVHQNFNFTEGPVETAQITAGPFDLHRKYRSMEGPYVNYTGRVSDFIASKSFTLPDSMVTYIEGGGPAASMNGGGSSDQTKPKGLIDTANQPRTLYWLKGFKLEVLDDQGKVLPTAEFICHYNLDVDRQFRDKAFPSMEKCPDSRLLTITQGQTEITFPEGYGVPVASDEKWNMVFQAANRTSNKHVVIKHRLTMYFIKDTDLVYPITALNWYTSYVRVMYDNVDELQIKLNKAMCPSCLGMSRGVNAPNNTPDGVFKDPSGRKVTGHWVIPPGVHTYGATTTEDWPGFATKDRVIHAVWSHIHPLCTELALYRCAGPDRQLIFSNHAETKTQPGLEIMNIDYLSSKEGILAPQASIAKLEQYELVATYNNTTGKPQDSMSVAGMFFEDPGFARPEWVTNLNHGYSCMVGQSCSAKSEPAVATTPKTPLFDVKKDGPLISSKRLVDVTTNAGVLHMELDPQLAPDTCTQMCKLFTSGAFKGTSIARYEPGFVLQVSNVEVKAPGLPEMTRSAKASVRRIPLEVGCQKDGKVKHKRFVLSMARWSDTTDNAEGSFSIVLGEAHHLDHEYAIFGRLIDDAASRNTLDKIEHNWSPTKYWVLDTQVRHS